MEISHRPMTTSRMDSSATLLLVSTNPLPAPARELSTICLYLRCKGEMENGEWHEGNYTLAPKLNFLSLLIEFASAT